jgi:CO/xanthine dehydrogenase FAD-binding subunit
MLPAPFEYDRPDTLEEALQLLAEHGEDAKVLAGGQSLIPLMKLRFAAPTRLIDVNRIAGLDAIEEADGFLRIGALVRLGRDQAALPDDRRGGSHDLRPDRAEPRHDRWIARTCGSLR